MTNTATNPLRLLPRTEPLPAPRASRQAGLEQAVEAFGRRLATDGRSSNTISAYLRDLKRFTGVLLTGAPRSPASLHRFKAAIRSFFAWAEETGLVSENPARSVILRRLPRTPPVFLTEAEKRRLLKELRGRSGALARRDRVIIEVFLGTGVRLQELVDLDVDDVAKHLHVRAKGDVPQVKFLKSNLRSLLRSYLKERRRQGDLSACHAQAGGECPALFLSNRGSRLSPGQVANRVKHWLAKSGINKGISPHGLRHTFATHLYAATSDLLVVKRALGHRDISTTEIYTHLVDNALEEAIERL